MRNRTKLIISLSLVLAFSFVFVIITLADHLVSFQMREWGKTLRENFVNTQYQENVYAKGKHGVVTNKDVEQAKKFYKLSGLNEDEAEKEAIAYVYEREALYQEAIKNGYSVTEEEVWDYIEELKRVIAGADNKEDVTEVMSQFDSEEDYWNYEFTVYQKNLPIQNYVRDLEQTYQESDQYSGESAEEKEESWQEYFKERKAELVSGEEYKVIGE